ARADRAGRPVHAVRTVAGAETAEPVPPHHTRVALALADGGDVDELTAREHVRLQLLADFVAVDVVEAELDDFDARVDAGLGEVPGLWLAHTAGLLPAERDLERVVAVVRFGLHLHDAAGRDLQDGDGDDAIAVAPHLRHADFLADDRLR